MIMAYKKAEIEKLFKTICERISNGESVKTICDSEYMPNRTTFYKWLNEDDKTEKKEKINKYARATSLRADSLFDETLIIADKYDNDVKFDKHGNEIINHNIINRDRLRVDTRKWAASKLNPKKYGDKTELQHSGEIKGTPVVIQYKGKDISLSE